SLSVDDGLVRRRATRDGLTEEDASARLDAVGPNSLPEAKRAGPLPLLAHLVFSPFVVILLGAAVLSIFVQNYLSAFVIALAVAVNVVIGFMQEFKAERALNALKSLNVPKALAMRGGVPRSIPSSELVPGDIVLLESGDAVPADARIVEAHGLEAEEAHITGESVPVPKSTEPVAAEASIGDCHCLVYLGTLVVGGHGTVVV